MTDEELVAIRLRDSQKGPLAELTQEERDRRALIRELDRVRILWDECQRHCFDPAIRAPARRG